MSRKKEKNLRIQGKVVIMLIQAGAVIPFFIVFASLIVVLALVGVFLAGANCISYVAQGVEHLIGGAATLAKTATDSVTHLVSASSTGAEFIGKGVENLFGTIGRQQFQLVANLSMSVSGLIVNGTSSVFSTAEDFLILTNEATNKLIKTVSAITNMTEYAVGFSMDAYSSFMSNSQLLLDYLGKFVFVPVIQAMTNISTKLVFRVLIEANQKILELLSGFGNVNIVVVRMLEVLGPVRAMYGFMSVYASVILGILNPLRTAIEAKTQFISEMNARLVEVPALVQQAIAAIAIDWNSVGQAPICDTIANSLVNAAVANSIDVGPFGDCLSEIAQFGLYHLTNGSFCAGTDVKARLTNCLLPSLQFSMTPVPSFGFTINGLGPVSFSSTFSMEPFYPSDYAGFDAALSLALDNFANTIETQRLQYPEMFGPLKTEIHNTVLSAVASAATSVWSVGCEGFRTWVNNQCSNYVHGICFYKKIPFMGSLPGPCTDTICGSLNLPSCPSLPIDYGDYA